ncbi:MAG: tetratricopeptide repeat protein [Anaerolineales bacterium]
MSVQSSLQSILDLRRQKEFTGREAELAFFREFLNSPPGGVGSKAIITLVGDGGVGKTWLMRQMKQIASNTGVPTTFCDEKQIDLLAAMAHMADQLEQNDIKLKKFSARYKVYRQKMNQIEADPDTPQGLVALLGKTAVQATFVAADFVPGLRKGLDYLPQDQLASQAGEWLNYLVKKLTNKDEVSLVLEPIQILSPLFLEDFQRGVAEHSQVILFLDTYEKTGEYLDPWLRDLFAGRYAGWPKNARLVIAGQEGLNRSQWTGFWALVAHRSLSPFSEEEARAYLTGKGVTDDRVVDVILRLSHRLPLLVATLAAESPQDPEKVGEPSGDAIELFLKWVEDPQRREVAVSAALPRRINRDLLTVLVGEEQSGPMFEWLSHIPFVEEVHEGWVYHGVVRSLMVRFKRRESPLSWAELHGKLADHFDELINSLGVKPERQFENATWQSFALEAGYHRLCQAYPRYRDILLNNFVRALQAQTAFAHTWADMFAQAERDLEMEPENTWGTKLAEGLRAFEDNRYQLASQLFTSLLNQVELQPANRAAALARRGLIHRLEGNYPAAIADLQEAIELNPEDAWALIQRGEAYRLHGKHEQALLDYDRAIDLDPENTLAHVLRGENYRQQEQFEKALAEFQTVIEKDPENAWAVVLRSETFRQVVRLQVALSGFDRAVELAPDDPYVVTHRGEAYRLLGQSEQALEDFAHAIELDPDFTWAWTLRGETRSQKGEIEAAIQDLSRAIQLNPDDPWPIALRGSAYRQSGQMQLALRDYDRALEIKPDYTWVLTLRGETYRQMDHFPEALADFNRALKNEPENVWTLTLRGETHRQMKNAQAALADLNRALQIEPGNSWVLTFRSQVYRDTEQYGQALADCTQALENQPEYAWPRAQRGETYRQTGRFEEAIADLSRAIELDPGDSWALARRAETYRQLGRYHESLRDFNQALDLNAEDAWAKERRRELYDALEFHHGAWKAAYKEQLLEVYFGEGEHKLQLAALHLNDSYLRLIYGPDSSWGTSAILLPVYWSKDELHQGGQVDVELSVEEADLILDFAGTVGQLRIRGQLRLEPPKESSILAHVRVDVQGEIDLDDRPREAFKPVMLSSMHISPEVWDAQLAYVGNRPHGIPERGWIVDPEKTGGRFGLRGGTSEWKENAPSVIIELDRPLTITGWVTASEDPNDDNVALWAASQELLSSWEYTVQSFKM